VGTGKEDREDMKESQTIVSDRGASGGIQKIRVATVFVVFNRCVFFCIAVYHCKWIILYKS